MPAGTIIIKTTDTARPPCGWFTGWLWVIGAGSAVSAAIGYDTYNVVSLIVFAAIDQNRAFGLAALSALITAPVLLWPIAFVFSVVPLSLSYIGLRLIGPRLHLTFRTRLAIGVVLGLATNGLLLITLLLRRPGLVLSGVAPFFPVPEIQTSALAVALVVRRRWFGIA